jgi:hypothetical protein
MIDIGPATEDEMVIAFLRAEVDSSRYGDIIRRSLTQFGLERGLIDEPNLADAAENAIRKQLLAFRGYEARTALFTGFPRDASWRRVTLEVPDFETIRYANYPTWVTLSDDTRLVSVGARNFLQRPSDVATQQIAAIAEDIRKGKRFPELIAAEPDGGSLVLIEGHSRATAYLIEHLEGPVEALIATSPLLTRWYFC